MFIRPRSCIRTLLYHRGACLESVLRFGHFDSKNVTLPQSGYFCSTSEDELRSRGLPDTTPYLDYSLGVCRLFSVYERARMASGLLSHPAIELVISGNMTCLYSNCVVPSLARHAGLR